MTKRLPSSPFRRRFIPAWLTWAVAGAAASLCFPSSFCRAAGEGSLSEAPGPRPTADQVLDGKIPGRPPALPVDAEYDPQGFATDRLYHVPAAGVHPRILFAPEDLPRIRKQLDATATGRELMTQMKQAAGAPENEPESWVATAYRALVAGDVKKFDEVCSQTPSAMPSGPPGAVGNSVNNLLFYRALEAELLDDPKLGREVAAAIATYTGSLTPKVKAVLDKPAAEHFWLEIRNVAPNIEGVGFLYDLAQPYMTRAQAGTTRDFIILCTKGHYGLGMDLPRHWRRWNFIGMGLYFPLMALSIEGEPGYDPRIIERGAEVARDYILYSLSKNGVGREAVGYQTAGMMHCTVIAVALANRGNNLMTLKPYRNMLEKWFLYAMQPFGRLWESGGDLGTFPPNASVVAAGRFFYPDSVPIKIVADQSVPGAKLDAAFCQENLIKFLCPVDLGADFAGKKPPVFPKDLPLTLYDDERGILFTRSSWEPDAATLQFECRSDTVYPAHDHADRGDFYFTALGQPWAVSAMRETETKFHSLITIDGKGQGFFAPPARWLGEQDSPAATFASVDTKYCYDWRWMKPSFLATDEQLKNEPWLEGFREPRDRLLERTPRDQWERDPLPQVEAYYKDWRAGDPRMWGEEDTWVVRSKNNPVQKSFRSIGFIRAPRPFVVIADDIKKDDAEHLYEWRMTLPMNVEAHDIKGADIILGPVSDQHVTQESVTTAYNDTGKPLAKPGTPLLLVRVLQMTATEPPIDSPTPSVETIEFVKTDDTHQFTGRSFGMGRRLVLPTRCVEPKYRVLLYPYRSGEQLPETAWESPGVLAVTAGGKTARIRFDEQPDGHTALSLAQ